MLKGDSHIDTAAHEHEEGASDAQCLSSRRGFLTGSAKLLGGGALALGLGAAPAFAKGNDDDEDKKQGASETTAAASQTSTSSTTPSFWSVWSTSSTGATSKGSAKIRSKAPPSSTGLATRFVAISTRTSCASATMRRST